MSQSAECVIEKGIPLFESRGAWTKYPWREMSVGDSFLTRNVSINTVSACASAAKRATGYNFVCRTVEGGVRVWRTA